jgi:RNA polymerase sigma-70 factor (ECF subfamily)
MNDLTSVTGNELRALGNQGFTLALRILRHREDAADAVQDAMHQLVRKHASYDARRGSMRSWFLRIVRNRCIDMQRKSRPTPAGDGFDPMDHTEQSPDDRTERRELTDRVRSALDRLSAEAREIVLLRDFLGLSYAEISDVLDVSSGTVMSRLHRARQKLREQVAHDEQTD